MSEVSDLIEQHRTGRLTLGELAERLAERKYREPSLYKSPPPWSRMSAEEYSREHLGLFPEEGTWQEVEAARLDGRLSVGDYWVLHDRVFGKAPDE